MIRRPLVHNFFFTGRRIRSQQQWALFCSSPDTKHADTPVLTWIDTALPASWIPYARLARIDKPIGTFLLLWPCAWSTALAATPPDGALLGLFAAGAFFMRGAGCTINDLWDQDIDARVRRTAQRPLASGAVSRKQAYAFLGAQLTGALGVLLWLPHTGYCVQWCVASLPLVAVYPSMKRFFPYPQLFLGLTFNWGAWVGWAATHGSMDYSIIVPLYTSGVTWTLVYDTLYAHQDKDDDRALGLYSTALTFGPEPRTLLHALAAATGLQWLWVGHMAGLHEIAYGLGVTAAYAHLAWQVQTAEFDNPHNLMERFRSNHTTGALLFGGLVAGKYFAGV